MIDLTKPVQTRSGLPARIASTKRVGRFPVLAIIEYLDGHEVDHKYTMGGSFMSFPGEHEMDLVNVPEKRVTYHTVRYSPDKNGGVFFGGMAMSSADAARDLIRPDTSWGKWDGVARIVREADRIVNLEFLDA